MRSRDVSRGGIARLNTGVALVTLMMAFPAAAQTAPVTGEAVPPKAAVAPATSQTPASDDGEIIVTGSLIARAGFTAPTPTTVFSAEEFSVRGFTNVGQITNAIPAFQAVNTPTGTTLTSTAAGGNFLNLRGLGDNRTLVLVNSRRFVPTNAQATVDTNVIPSALIDRIDVVTGGASAAYGADAVAGVVNIILKKSLDGFVGSIQGGISNQGDDANYKGSLGWGTEFGGGRGHFVIAAEGERSEGIGRQTERRWGRGGYAVLDNPTGGPPSSLVAADVQYSLQTLGGLILSGVNRGTDFGPGGTPRAFVTGPSDGFNQIGGSGFRGADYLTLSVPYDRYSIYARGDYDLGPATFFVEYSHSYSKGDLPIIPASNFGSIVIQQDNFFLDPGLKAKMVAAGEQSFRMGRFFADFGPLTVKLSNKTDRVVAGFDGAFSDRWKWNVYGEYGHTLSINERGNNQNLALFNKSLDAVAGPGGQPVCRVNADADPSNNDSACVPVNIFGNGSPSAAAQAYFLGTSVIRSKIDQAMAAATINGDLFDFNGRPVAVAIGASYREDKIDGRADPISQVNGFAFGNPKSIAGKQDVKEAYGELAVPLLHDMPLFKSLDLNGAVRVIDYSGSGTVTTWKAGATWDVNDSIRLRVTRSRDIRAPNLTELYGSSNINFEALTDILTGARGNTKVTTGGNPNLRPEKADTWTAGIVLTPTFAPGLRLSVDYYDIKIAGVVTTLSSSEIVARCLAGDASACSFITHDATGQQFLFNTFQNLDSSNARGLDFEVAYRSRLGAGDLGLRWLATYVDTLSKTNRGITIDRAGEVSGNNNGLPHWQFNLSADYRNGRLNLFAENRFIGGGRYDNTLGPNAINFQHIGAVDYTNIGASYDLLSRGKQSLQLFGNINNLFDRDPPLVPSNSFAAFQTNPTLYDVVGRQFIAGVRFKY